MRLEAPSDNIIRLENISKDYPTGSVVHALSNISLRIEQGERVAVMGPSGSGKSTLLNVICGLDAPTSGTMFFEGVDLFRLNDDARTRLRRDKIGMIFQTFNLLPTMTAVENVALPLRLKGLRRRQADSRAIAMLGMVGLTSRMSHVPDQLSGGERQRVAIARALVFEPPLLLADEPTGNLDSETGEEVLNLLHDLHGQFNTTILLVTHNPLAAAHCSRVLMISDGQLVQDKLIFKAQSL